MQSPQSPQFAGTSAARKSGTGKARVRALVFTTIVAGVSLTGAAAAQTAGRPAEGAQHVRLASPGFWEAVRLDDVDKLQTEMLRGASANAEHPELGPAVVAAARERSPKVLAYLAQLGGTRVDAPNRRDETALMLTALNGDLPSAQLLVRRGAEVNRPGWTPLHYAAANGHVPVITYLLEQHAYIDAESPNGTTPLMMAARQKHTNAVRVLVEAGADPSVRNGAGMTAADYMTANGETVEAQWLRERTAEFVQRFGTVENPRPAGSIAAHPAGDPPASVAPVAPVAPVTPVTPVLAAPAAAAPAHDEAGTEGTAPDGSLEGADRWRPYQPAPGPRLPGVRD
jgi:hypothetical protein